MVIDFPVGCLDPSGPVPESVSTSPPGVRLSPGELWLKKISGFYIDPKRCLLGESRNESKLRIAAIAIAT